LSVDNLQKRWCGEATSLDPAEEGVWIIPPFTEQAAVATPTAGAPVSATPTDASATKPLAATPATGETSAAPRPAPTGRTIRKIVVSGEVPVESWADLFRSFVSPAARMRLKHLRLGIQFEFESAPDQPLHEDDAAVKAMKESAQQLALDLNMEE